MSAPRPVVRRPAIAIAVATLAVASSLALGSSAAFSASPSPTPTPAAPAAAGKPAPQKAVTATTEPGSVAGVKVTSAPIHADAAPTNDDYAHAVSVPSFSSWHANASTVGATTEPGEQRELGLGSGFEVYNSIWYRWRAPASGAADISMLDTSSLSAPVESDTSLAIFTGSTLAKAKRIAWDDDSATTNVLSEIRSVKIIGGTTYYLQVGLAGPIGLSAANAELRAGTVHIQVSPTYATPSNDNMASARSETASVWTAVGNTLGSTLEKDEPVANSVTPASPALNSIWYTWTAQADGTINVADSATDLNAANEGSAYLAMYSQNERFALTQLLFKQGQSNSFSNFAVSAGTTYYFQLGETATFASGPVSLHLAANYTGPIISRLSKSSGKAKGGKTITVHGSRLGSVTHVYFGTTPGTIVKISSNSKIKVRTPAHAKGKTWFFLIGTNGSTPITPTREFTFK